MGAPRIRGTIAGDHLIRYTLFIAPRLLVFGLLPLDFHVYLIFAISLSVGSETELNRTSRV
jgi:hypothetical protein